MLCLGTHGVVGRMGMGGIARASEVSEISSLARDALGSPKAERFFLMCIIAIAI